MNTTSSSFDSKRAFSYLFILGLAVLFTLEWGPGARGCEKGARNGRSLSRTDWSPSDTIATVNGRPVLLADFNRAYASQVENYKKYGLTSDMAKQMGMPKQVTDQLVKNELLSQAAEQHGVVATDAEVREAIAKISVFQKDGVFNVDNYRSFLHDYEQRTEADFEAEMRRELSQQKMISLVESGASVSEDEVSAYYLKTADKVKLSYVKFDSQTFADKVPAPKEAELDVWMKANEKPIADYYAANSMTYFQPERVRARQILIRTNKDDTAAKKDEAKQKIANLRKEIAAGKDFSAVAKEFSEDTETKEKGGDIGLQERVGMPPALADVLFKAKVGDLTEVVETPVGYFIAKVEEKKAPETKPLESVRSVIAKQLWARDRAKMLAKAEAEKAFEAAKKGKTLAELFPVSKDDAEAKGNFKKPSNKVQVVDSGDFNSTSNQVPLIPSSQDLFKASVAAAKPGLLPQVFSAGDAFVVAIVTDRQHPSDEDFAKQKAAMEKQAIQTKRVELQQAYLEALKKSANVVLNEANMEKATNGA